MNIRRLRYFLRIAAEGSLSKAAQAYGIAQPALTRQMQLLEEEIGTKVFERSSRGLKLTETGQFLKDAIEMPLGEIEAALSNAHSYPKQVKASLTLGFPPQLSTLIGTRIVTRLQKELPNIALRIFEENSTNLASGLSRRIVDAAFLVTTAPEPGVPRTELLSERLFLVGAPSSTLKEKAVPVKKLADLPLVLPAAPNGLRMVLAHAESMARIRIMPIMEVHSLALTKQIVQSGGLYTLLPKRAFLDDLKRETLTCWPIIEPELTQSVMWAIKTGWRLPRVIHNELERVVILEAHDAVTRGRWPAEWLYDLATWPLHR